MRLTNKKKIIIIIIIVEPDGSCGFNPCPGPILIDFKIFGVFIRIFLTDDHGQTLNKAGII